MIYMLGTASDSTVRHFVRASGRLEEEVTWIDLRTQSDGRWHIDVDGATRFMATKA